MDKEKKCIFCKRKIVGKSWLGMCPSCRNRAGEIGTGALTVVGTAGAVIIKVLSGKNKDA